MLVFILPVSVLGTVFLWLSVEWVARSLTSRRVPKIYVQPGFFYPLKYYMFRGLLWLRKRQNKKRQQLKQASSENAGYGIRSRNSPEDMDRVQKLPKEHPQAVDAVYFNAGNADGFYIVAATARRHENIVQTILYLRIPDIGLLEMPTLPDTWLSDPESVTAYTAGGLHIAPVRPMQAWSLVYDGMMRIAETGLQVKVKFNLMWKAYTKPFDFDTDLHPHAMAKGIARENWSRKYFETLKSAHQTHYEQFGEISGTVHINGHPDQDVRMQGVRDHSYGNVRDWKSLHRYALNYAHLEDGTALCVGVICMPITLSRLVVGYIFHPTGFVSTVRDTDFEFYNWGDSGNPPQKLIINFTAGYRNYHMICEVVQSAIFYMGKDWDAKIHERFCTYSVNGVKGWGISEWDYCVVRIIAVTELPHSIAIRSNYTGKEAEMKRLDLQNSG